MTIDTSKEAVERLMDGVTPGPWEVRGKQTVGTGQMTIAKCGRKNGSADARFIAAARELVPALAAERDAQTARADAAEAEVARLTAERDTASAEVAMMVDVAATEVMDAAIVWSVDHDEASHQLAGWIRAKTPAYATAALDAKLRAERNKALRDAVTVAHRKRGDGDTPEAILAMIEPEGLTNE